MFSLRSHLVKTCMAVPTLATLSVLSNSSHCSTNDTADTANSFSTKEFRKFPITSIEQLTPDTKHITCSLPTPNSQMGLPISSCVMIKSDKLDKNEKVVAKPYTPTSTNDQKGKFDLVVKVYPGGAVTGYLDNLVVGDEIEVKGPFKKLQYKPNMKKNIGFVCGGSGLTPCLQVIREILSNPEDTTEISMVFANNSIEDIILRKELDALAAKHKNFQVTYVVAANPTYAPYPKGCYTGFINESMLRMTMPEASNDTLIYVCGPPGLMNAVCGAKKPPKYDQGEVEGLLKKMGYNSDMVFKF